MRDEQPSQTALGAAWLRALHVAAEASAPVFDDSAAALWLPAWQQRQLASIARLRTWRNPFQLPRPAFENMPSQVIVRGRYAEDALEAARGRGCSRYVILGAGLDSYAERHVADAKPLPVIEIDHPATQAWKRRLMAERGATEPPAVSYRAIDFERTPLNEVLERPDGPQFIAWMGTTYYLSRRAITDTLAALAELSPPGSELVLDYWRATCPPDAGTLALGAARLASLLAPEPLVSFPGAGEMETLARSAGWRVREHCPADIQNARYLEARRDGMRVPSFSCLLHLER